MRVMVWMESCNRRASAAAELNAIDEGQGTPFSRSFVRLPGEGRVMSSNFVRAPPDTTPREMPPAVKPAGAEDLLLKDPVCGMSVTVRSPHMAIQEGAAIYFCSAGCKTKY